MCKVKSQDKMIAKSLKGNVGEKGERRISQWSVLETKEKTFFDNLPVMKSATKNYGEVCFFPWAC
jgi:hypothetical protein